MTKGQKKEITSIEKENKKLAKENNRLGIKINKNINIILNNNSRILAIQPEKSKPTNKRIKKINDENLPIEIIKNKTKKKLKKPMSKTKNISMSERQRVEYEQIEKTSKLRRKQDAQRPGLRKDIQSMF